MKRMSLSMKKETLKAEMPIKKEMTRVVNNLLFSSGKNLLKSCTTFELIAHKRELAVELMAAMIPQTASKKMSLLDTKKSTDISGLAPSGIITCFIRARMPKKIGIHEKMIKNMPAKKADMVAVAFVFAAKNF